jgi:hypothetical protein
MFERERGIKVKVKEKIGRKKVICKNSKCDWYKVELFVAAIVIEGFGIEI